MDQPKDVSLPFFAYGIFRPGQLAYFQIREFVKLRDENAQVKGSILLRDGLPIIDPERNGMVEGASLEFLSIQASEDAYQRISKMEPDKQYRWGETQCGGKKVNLLIGRMPDKGSVTPDDQHWDGWEDPVFTAALEVAGETITGAEKFSWDLKPFFRLQMGYLLLWSAVERYVSLRYSLGKDTTNKVNRIATEHQFGESLKKHVTACRKLFRADQPEKFVKLDPLKPKDSIEYYYQVRCNITHRGKSSSTDHKTLSDSSTELLAIFNEVLAAAKQESQA